MNELHKNWNFVKRQMYAVYTTSQTVWEVLSKDGAIGWAGLKHLGGSSHAPFHMDPIVYSRLRREFGQDGGLVSPRKKQKRILERGGKKGEKQPWEDAEWHAQDSALLHRPSF